MQTAENIQWERQDAAGALRLRGVVDIFDAECLRDIANDAARAITSETTGDASDAPIVLDMSQVERLDVSIVQILCAFRQALTEAGRTLRVSSMPEGVARSLATLGVTL